MDTRRRPAIYLLVFSVLSVGACAGPDLDAEVTTFAAATRTAVDRTVTLADDFNEAELRGRRQQARAAPDRVRPDTEHNCEEGASGCRLSFVTRSGSVSLSESDELPRIRALAGLLAAYADGLGKLVAAGSQEEADAAFAALGTNITSLRAVGAGDDAAAKARAAAFEKKVSAGTSIASYITGKALDTLKLRYLRQTTAEADEPFGKAAAVLGTAGDAARRPAIEAARAKLDDAEKAFRAAPAREQTLVQYLAAATELDAVLRASPKPLLDELALAHSRLRDWATIPDQTSTSLAAQLQAVKAEADKLLKVIEAIRAARKKTTDGAAAS